MADQMQHRQPSPSTPPEHRNAHIEERTPSYFPLANTVNIGHLHHLDLNLASGSGYGLDWVTRAHQRAPRRRSVSLEAQKAGDDVLAALGLLERGVGVAGAGGNGGGNGNGGRRGNAGFDGDGDSDSDSDGEAGRELMRYHDELVRRGRRGVRSRRSERESQRERERDRLASHLDSQNREEHFAHTSPPAPYIDNQHHQHQHHHHHTHHRCPRCNPHHNSPPPHPHHPAHCTCSPRPPPMPFMHRWDASFVSRARRAGDGEYIRLRTGGEKAFVRSKKKKGGRKDQGVGAGGRWEEAWGVYQERVF